MLDQGNPFNTAGNINRFVFRAIIYNEQFKIINPYFAQGIADGQNAMRNLGDAVFFVIGWYYNRKCGDNFVTPIDLLRML